MLKSSSIIIATIWILVMGSFLPLGGCASGVPTYPTMSDRESLEVLAQRADAIRTVRATIDLAITNGQGQSIELEGAIAAVLPDRLRLQAWKMGVTVLDVTYTSGEVWTVTDADQGSEQEIETLRGTSASDFEQMLAPTRAEFWRKATPVQSAESENELVVDSGWPVAGGMRCFIDRRSLTAQRLILADRSLQAQVDRSLILEQYQSFDGVIWPTRMIFNSPDGIVRVNLKEVEINQPIDDAAFQPPRRAKKHL